MPETPQGLAHTPVSSPHVMTIIRIENNQLRTAPHYGTLRKLARLLDIEPTELLED